MDAFLVLAVLAQRPDSPGRVGAGPVDAPLGFLLPLALSLGGQRAFHPSRLVADLDLAVQLLADRLGRLMSSTLLGRSAATAEC